MYIQSKSDNKKCIGCRVFLHQNNSQYAHKIIFFVRLNWRRNITSSLWEVSYSTKFIIRRVNLQWRVVWMIRGRRVCLSYTATDLLQCPDSTEKEAFQLVMCYQIDQSNRKASRSWNGNVFFSNKVPSSFKIMRYISLRLAYMSV